MQELKRLLSSEQHAVNAAIDKYVKEMPASARPVAEHILASGGKRLRPFLTLLTGRALGGKDERLYILGAAVEILHAATLLHDDILDNSDLRRGKPAAHTVFGASKAILAGDAMLAKAVLTVSELGDTRLTDCISEAVMRTAEGEILEFDQLGSGNFSLDGYLAMITGKTAWMLRASCELGALDAGAAPSVVKAAADFGLELGIAFQMVDDALDFSPSTATGKPRGGDVREGKITPPLAFYLDALAPSESARLREKITAGNLSDAELQAVCSGVFDGGFAQKTRDTANAHLTSAASSLHLFPDSPHRLVLEQMLLYIKARES